MVENFKYSCLDWYVRGDQENKIFHKMEEIQHTYVEESILKSYNDEQLAEMMLLDGCFIMNLMYNFLEWDNENMAELLVMQAWLYP